MSIRRKRRQRGKRRALRKEALKTWDRLTHVAEEPKVTAWPGVVLPIIRNVMPSMIANEIVGVQPMTAPVGDMFRDAALGIDPIWSFDHEVEEKKTPYARKKERAAEKRQRKRMEKVIREIRGKAEDS